MTQQPELVTAARTLLHWARTRQTVWRDPSTDLIAALGDRYQSFMDQSGGGRRPSSPAPQPPPLREDFPVPASGAAPMVRPAPVVPAAPIIPAELTLTARPSIIPPPRPVPKPVWRQPLAERASSEPGAIEKPKSRWLMKGLVGAGVAVAALAAPAVWHRSRAPAAAIASPPTGTLALDSTPPGSAVRIDGVERGTTPLAVPLAPGEHAIEFRYRKGTRALTVMIAAGAATTSSVDWTRKSRPRLQSRPDKPDAVPPRATPAPPAAAPAEPAGPDTP